MVTDQDFTDLSVQLDNLYRDELGRSPIETFVDPLGRARWTSDYVTERLRGRDHARAMFIVKNSIRRVAGLPVEEPIRPPKPQGQLGYDGRGLTKGGQYVLPVVCHLMEGFSRYTRDRDYVRNLLDKIAAAGYDAVRTLDVLGWYGEAWRDREVTPVPSRAREGHSVAATPDYYRQLEDYILELHDRGLGIVWSRGDLQLLSPRQTEEHFEILGSLGVPSEAIYLFEGCNEAWQNGQPDSATLRDLVRRFSRQRPGVLTGLSAPPNSSEENRDLQEWSEGVDMVVVHGFRGGEYTDRIRHIFSLSYDGLGTFGRRVAWQMEPSGPRREGERGVSGGATNDPEALGAMAAVSLLSRQAWTYMSSGGVFLSERPFEEQTGFDLIPRVRDLIPSDVMTYDRLWHGGRSEAVLIAPDRVYAERGGGLHRVDQAVDDTGKIVALAHGAVDGKPQLVKNDSERRFEGVVINPGTAESRDIVIGPGQTVQVDFRVARLFVGKLV